MTNHPNRSAFSYSVNIAHPDMMGSTPARHARFINYGDADRYAKWLSSISTTRMMVEVWGPEGRMRVYQRGRMAA